MPLEVIRMFRYYQSSIYPLVIILLILNIIPTVNCAEYDMKAVVDATDMPRGLLRATMEFEVNPGTFELYYPKWVAGVHGPKSPIHNLAEIIALGQDGNRLQWHRNPRNIYHILIDIPQGVNQIQVKTTYLCNQPTTGSTGVDSHGIPHIGVINWNTCLLYPVGYTISEIMVSPVLTLSEGWKWGASLEAKMEEDSTIQFKPVSFRRLVDSPLICGKHLHKYDITPDNGTPHYLVVASESKHAIQLEDDILAKCKKMTAEALALFGTSHDYAYTFLLVLSDNLPFMGLEHTRSSLNVVGERGLSDQANHRTTFHLMIHEYAHRWCGKYHRPAGMATSDYQTPKDLRLLWVYEGLDQYLGVVLTARSGLFATSSRSSFEGALQDEWVGVGKTLVSLMRQKGRLTMNLEDTAVSSFLRRRPSEHWAYLKRPQDYYFEGALLWYEIDAILRNETDGSVTLDDFIKRFLGRYDEDKALMTYDEQMLIDMLNELHRYDWQSLINDRVRGWHQEIPLEVLDRLGYRILYSPKPTNYDSDSSLTSLGMKIAGNGEINTIVPGSPADQAGLYEGMKIIGINQRKYNPNRLRDAIADSPVKRNIELLILKGDYFETINIPYDDGPKYIDIVRNQDKPDILKKIFAPKTE